MEIHILNKLAIKRGLNAAKIGFGSTKNNVLVISEKLWDKLFDFDLHRNEVLITDKLKFNTAPTHTDCTLWLTKTHYKSNKLDIYYYMLTRRKPVPLLKTKGNIEWKIFGKYISGSADNGDDGLPCNIPMPIVISY